MQNDYLTNTVTTCGNCGSARLTAHGDSVICENCSADQTNTGPDSSGWDRIWRAASGESIRYKRL